MKIQTYNPKASDQTLPYQAGKFNALDGKEIVDSVNALYDEVEQIPAGANGKSAYELALDAGFVGTQTEWLDSLQGGPGATGLSAYQVAVVAGFVGTVNQWVASLQGAAGKSAYELALAGGFVGTLVQWVESLEGAAGTNGKSAYQLALDNGYVGTVNQWITSLNGAKGDSAYTIALAGGFVGTQTQWLASLVGTPGASAYAIAVANGFVGTQTQWLASLVGQQGPAGVSLVKTYALSVNVVNSTTVYAPVITIPLKANTKYKIDFNIKASCDSVNGNRTALTTPAGSTYSAQLFANTSAATNFSVFRSVADATLLGPWGTAILVESTAFNATLRGTIETAAAGNLIVNMSNNGGGNVTTWKTGSFFTVEEITA